MRSQSYPITEPASSTAAGILGWKLLGGAAGAATAAAAVVMLMTPPRNRREWAVGLICTLVGSICGGAAVVQYLNLAAWMDSYPGLVALIGIAFACGLPAWAVVRWCFTWMERRQDKDIVEVAADLRRSLGDRP